jgi:hypothetical protein
MSCPACGCTTIGNEADRAHALVAALQADDIDQALTLGLLDEAVACAACSEACHALLRAARVQRQRALAARDRFRARTERLERRQRERADRRKPAATASKTSSLPPAAAAALARARARAAGRTGS